MKLLSSLVARYPWTRRMISLLTCLQLLVSVFLSACSTSNYVSLVLAVNVSLFHEACHEAYMAYARAHTCARTHAHAHACALTWTHAHAPACTCSANAGATCPSGRAWKNTCTCNANAGATCPSGRAWKNTRIRHTEQDPADNMRMHASLRTETPRLCRWQD